MDEEGTVVYFQSSPAVQGYEGSDGGLQELVFTDYCPANPAENDGQQSEVRSTSKAKKGVPWTQASLGSLSWFGNQSKELRDARQVVERIKESPLLTEEDFQLLHFTTALRKWPNVTLSSANFSTLRLRTSRLKRMRYLLVSSITTALLAWGMAVSSWKFLVAATLIILTISGCVAMATKLLQYLRVKKTQSAMADLSTYNSKFESLLALLTQTIRLVQETEVISCGYTRPSEGVPIARVERHSSAGGYQCTALRRRVFETSQQGIVLLRRITQSLCKNYPLTEELDNIHKYLAYTLLENLHPPFQQQATEAMSAAECAPCLSLESLKDASNLLAVQNSEMLRRLALNLTPMPGSSQKLTRFSLADLSQMLRDPLDFVSEALEMLTWSFEFHKNHLFGDPPVRSKALEKTEGKAHPLVQAIAGEVHCIDFKLQVALQRTRDLGLLLVKLQMSEENPGLLQDTDRETIRAQLLSIQHGTEGIEDHLTEGSQLIDKLQEPQTDPKDQASSTDVTMVDSDDVSPADRQQPSEEESSDEEMVFEAYVCAENSEREGSQQQLGEDNLEQQQRVARETPLKMVKELRSVLAVRSLEKQKRREEKQKRKLLKDSQVSPDTKSYLRDSHAPNQPLPTNERAVGGELSSQLHVEGKDQGERHVEAHTEGKPVGTCGTDVLQHQKPSEANLHVQSGTVKFGTPDMVQNLKTSGDGMHSKPVGTCGTDVLQNQEPSEADLHVQSDTMKFGTPDMLVQNPKTSGNGMHSEAARLNVTTTHNAGDCYEDRNGTHSEGSECGGGDSGTVIADGGEDCRTARADDEGCLQEEWGWDSRSMAEAVAAMAVLSGRNREEIFQSSSESVDD